LVNFPSAQWAQNTDKSNELVEVERLVDRQSSSQLPGRRMGRGIAEGGHADKGGTPGQVVQGFENFQAGQGRHAQVGQYEIEPFAPRFRMGLQAFQQFQSVAATGYTVSGTKQGEGEQFPQVMIVFGEQNPGVGIFKVFLSHPGASDKGFLACKATLVPRQILFKNGVLT
jgi:hypothetical protein